MAFRKDAAIPHRAMTSLLLALSVTLGACAYLGRLRSSEGGTISV